jgi:glyoxylase-like metal-dependent hydrolase (beta-lactamase superfamily II)
MKISSIRRNSVFLPALFALPFFLAVSAHAQGMDFSKVTIKTTMMTNNFYMLEGAGGTMGILTGPDGTLLVDTEYAPLTDKIVAAIKQVSTGPIRFVINTHYHGDHTGGDENFGKLGATLFARPQLRERLAHPAPGANGAPGVPTPAVGLPLVTFDSTITFHMDGEEADAIPIPHAHTDGDTMVHFRTADIIMSGDFYRSVGYPNIDRAGGGSLNGMIEGLGALAALAGPNTKIIPGHGAVVNRTAVTAQRDMIIALRDRVAKMIQQGKTVDEVLAAHVTADYDPMVAPVPGSKDLAQDRFIGQVYAELKAGK